MPSEKILEQKKALVASLSDKLKNSCAGVIVNYKGINVSDDTKLRKELRESGVEYFVVKNTLLQRAAKEAGLDGLEPVLEGTTAIAISKEDHVAAARILCKFADENDFFKAKAGFIEGKVISEAEVNNLAKLPTKEVLVAKALGGLNAPISGFVTVLNGTIKGLVVALNAIAEKQSA
ncbi:50S ribosomal protein L10 [Clostridium sp. CAG:557]|nr:50S ribosomal protein L10 [Clostridium sp. CAG:557]